MAEPTNKERICKIKNCNNEVKTKGLCSHHYYKLRTYVVAKLTRRILRAPSK